MIYSEDVFNLLYLNTITAGNSTGSASSASGDDALLMKGGNEDPNCLVIATDDRLRGFFLGLLVLEMESNAVTSTLTLIHLSY